MAKKKKGTHIQRVKTLLTSLVLGANLVMLCSLWLCCASTWVNPAVHSRVAVIGLGFPVALLLNLVFIPLWLIYKPRMVLVPIVGMALCGGFILDYFPLHRKGNVEEGDLKVLSWNAYNPATYSPDSLVVMMKYIEESDADIICLQEISFNRDSYAPLREAMQAKGYYMEAESQRVLLSRYPILGWSKIEAESVKRNNTIAFEILMDGDTVSVLNAHLECYHFTDADKNDYKDVLQTPEKEMVETEARYLLGKLSTASRYRAYQVQALVEFMDSLPATRPILLCGDFNDTPISYAYQTINKHLTSAFRESGRGVGVSYTEKIFPVRIDHIFHSKEWEGVYTQIDYSVGASDHYPIVATLRKRQK